MTKSSPQLETLDAERRHITARIGVIQRHNGPRDPRLPELRDQLRAVRRAMFVQETIDKAPPLSAAQRSTLRALLTGAEGAETNSEPAA